MEEGFIKLSTLYHFLYAQKRRICYLKKQIQKMNRLLTILFVSSVFCTTGVYAQNVGVGTSSPDNSAKLDVSATDGGLLIPRMTEVQRDAISSPATGLMIFQTDGTVGFYFYDGTAWTAIVKRFRHTRSCWPTGPQGQGLEQLRGPAGLQHKVLQERKVHGPRRRIGAQGPQGSKVHRVHKVFPDGAKDALNPAGATGATGPAWSSRILVQTEHKVLKALKVLKVLLDKVQRQEQGIQGDPGADGAQGPQGPAGPAGATGAIGAQGPQGIQGVPGADGADGDTWWTEASGNIYRASGFVGFWTTTPSYHLDARGANNDDGATLSLSNADYSRWLRVFPGKSSDVDPLIMFRDNGALRFADDQNNYTEITRMFTGLNGDPTLEMGVNTAAWGRLGSVNGLAVWGNSNADTDNDPHFYINTNGQCWRNGTTATTG